MTALVSVRCKIDGFSLSQKWAKIFRLETHYACGIIIRFGCNTAKRGGFQCFLTGISRLD